MEQFEDPSQNGHEKKKKKNTMWSEEMDKCLIAALLFQCNEGNKIDKGFKELAYTAAANALNAEFNLNLDKDHIINRMKTIKKSYRDIELMIGQSGFTFNFTTKKVECSDRVWETYVKAHPRVKNLRYKRLEMLEELGIICGNDAATGEWCRGGPDVSGTRGSRNMTGETMDDIEYEDIEGGIGVESLSQAPKPNTQQVGNNRTTSSTHESSRKHGRRGKKSEAYSETMTAVASSIKQMAAAMERKNEIEFKKAKFDEQVDATMLLKTLQIIEGLSEDDVAEAFENLLGDEIKARAFMTYSTDLRIKFLNRHYGISIITSNFDSYANL